MGLVVLRVHKVMSKIEVGGNNIQHSHVRYYSEHHLISQSQDRLNPGLLSKVQGEIELTTVEPRHMHLDTKDANFTHLT